MASVVRARVLLFAALLMTLASMSAPAAAVAQDSRVADVTAAAVELSRLERSGDLLTLHDLLQPDVRLVVSRAALARWYRGPAAVVPTADPAILSVAFGAWTWPVTGRTYADVATVTVRQPGVVGGVALEQVEVQHYWFDGSRWRWFFGADAAFIDALRARVPAEPEMGGFEALEYARVDAIWSTIYQEAGLAYRPPADIEITTLGQLPLLTGCGLVTEEVFPGTFYCPGDEVIYISEEYEARDTRRFGDYSIRFTISHEWGHHLQVLEGIDVSEVPELDDGYYAIEIELQADCLAGVYAQEAMARGWATEEDLDVAYRVTEGIGDDSDVTFDDPTAHGDGAQRRQAFTAGLEDGLFGCNFYPGMGG